MKPPPHIRFEVRMLLPSVVLRHTTRTGSHYDWLLGDPRDACGRLITFRTVRPPGIWQSLRHWNLTPIAPHRRAYLTFEGPISGGRGSVVRVDRGMAAMLHASRSRMILDLRLQQCHGRVELVRVSPVLWRAALVASAAGEAEQAWE